MVGIPFEGVAPSAAACEAADAEHATSAAAVFSRCSLVVEFRDNVFDDDDPPVVQPSAMIEVIPHGPQPDVMEREAVSHEQRRRSLVSWEGFKARYGPAKATKVAAPAPARTRIKKKSKPEAAAPARAMKARQ